MRFPYVLIKEDKIKFKDSQLQGYKNLIDEKDELLKEKFIENMRLETEIFSIKKQLNDYIEYYRDEKQKKVEERQVLETFQVEPSRDEFIPMPTARAIIKWLENDEYLPF